MANRNGKSKTIYMILGVLVVLGIIVTAYFLLQGNGNDPGGGGGGGGSGGCTPIGDEVVDNVDTYYRPPNATSCKGWDCKIYGQFCPQGVTGADDTGYLCSAVGKWVAATIDQGRCRPHTCIDNYEFFSGKCVESAPGLPTGHTK